MPSISTHVLNSENGTHVAGLTVTLTYIEPDGGRKKIFSNKTDTGGRLVQNFDFILSSNEIFEIEFKLSDIHNKKKGIYDRWVATQERRALRKKKLEEERKRKKGKGKEAKVGK